MTFCPACRSEHVGQLESRLTAAGKRRRRHECRDCGNRWTTWEEGAAEPRPRPPFRPMPDRRHLTDDQVRVILMDRRSNRAMARELGRSAETIRQVRMGILRAYMHPEIPRWNQTDAPVSSGASCLKCQHWADHCTFGYPDPIQEGPAFANDCAMYTP